MNIYFCREYDENAGLFVIAVSRGKAKEIFAGEVDCRFTDVRSSIRKRGVSELEQRSLFADIKEDVLVLERYGLAYDEEEEI